MFSTVSAKWRGIYSKIMNNSLAIFPMESRQFGMHYAEFVDRFITVTYVYSYTFTEPLL